MIITTICLKMTYACLTCVLIFVLLVLLECPAILVSAGQAGQKSGQTGHLVTLIMGPKDVFIFLCAIFDISFNLIFIIIFLMILNVASI